MHVCCSVCCNLVLGVAACVEVFIAVCVLQCVGCSVCVAVYVLWSVVYCKLCCGVVPVLQCASVCCSVFRRVVVCVAEAVCAHMRNTHWE